MSTCTGVLHFSSDADQGPGDHCTDRVVQKVRMICSNELSMCLHDCHVTVMWVSCDCHVTVCRCTCVAGEVLTKISCEIAQDEKFCRCVVRNNGDEKLVPREIMNNL